MVEHAFRANAGDRFVVTLDSSAFDPLVRVGRMNGPDFVEISSNDDAPGGGLNSTIAGLDTTHPFSAIKEFKDRYRCIASDLRNANGGQSSGPLEVDRPWDSHTDDQLGLMDHLGIKQFMVLGYCIGGPFIWNLLKRAPDRVVAAVLTQPSGFRPELPNQFYDNNIANWGLALVAAVVPVIPTVIAPVAAVVPTVVMVRAAPVVAAIVARQHGSGDGEGQDGTGHGLEKALGIHGNPSGWHVSPSCRSHLNRFRLENGYGHVNDALAKCIQPPVGRVRAAIIAAFPFASPPAAARQGAGACVPEPACPRNTSTP